MHDPFLLVLVFLVAALYSSVGHGGASGYLAALALYGLAPTQMKTSALILNLLVAAISFLNYRKAGHFNARLFWPFAVSSIPAAFIGGFVKVSPRLYAGLLAFALCAAALRLILPDFKRTNPRPPSRDIAAGVGAGAGLLSGIVGVGGGIFLSPIVILCGWADAKTTAGVSAAFIWVNSAAGLLGQIKQRTAGALALWPLALAAAAGGLIGSAIGAQRLTPLSLRRLLGAVLLVAAYKIA